MKITASLLLSIAILPMAALSVSGVAETNNAASA